YRDGIRRYMQAHRCSNSTTTDLWNALSEASGKPVAEIADGWKEQPGFTVVTVKREANGKVTLSQERFTINFHDNVDAIWKHPLTYLIDGQSAQATLLMASKTESLADVTTDVDVQIHV